MSNVGGRLECKRYYAKGKDSIHLSFKDEWKIEIEFLEKSYSSLMESFVIFCYPVVADPIIQAQKTINIYHDEEAMIDGIISRTITSYNLDLADWFGKDLGSIWSSRKA
ncbi:hypothetical protein J0B03_05520 [Alkalibacter rhizosphaerae]|uniref:Uncharacterized protein n=1 Tax=Alkalibacter rhizosphaerae TaxID=2815577 RepID=A0A974XGM7_9FIRM|nr:hypothetical protein [Alkalibacter rhizosphaerae]QSX09522.1 hypothetical protein J0B03_05520 [Alkalibacter rhizosphaerae]